MALLTTELFIAKDLNEKQRQIFLTEMSASKKQSLTYYLLLIFLGGVGAHAFYTGQQVKGIVYIICIISFWLVIPLIVLLCLFLIDLIDGTKMVRKANERIAEEVLQKIQLLFPETETT